MSQIAYNVLHTKCAMMQDIRAGLFAVRCPLAAGRRAATQGQDHHYTGT